MNELEQDWSDHAHCSSLSTQLITHNYRGGTQYTSITQQQYEMAV